MSKGFDAAQPVGGIAQKIVGAGLDFVCRYYSRSNRKNLSLNEAQTLSAAGINIVTVWEAAGDRAEAFSAESGARDARDALACAAKVQQPEGTAIYFAVDFDATVFLASERIIPYFRAVKAGLADRYDVGVYGSGLVCRMLSAEKLVLFRWLGGAMGWAQSRDYTNWHIKQGLPSDPYGFGFQVDPDESKGENYGQWCLPMPAPPVEIHQVLRLTSPPMRGDDVSELQRGLAAWGEDPGAIDGVFGKRTGIALVMFQSANGLTADGICGPITWTALSQKRG